MRRIPAAVALLALAGGLVSMAAPAGAEESDATEATEATDLIVLDGVLTVDLISLGLDATLTVAGTGVADVTVVVGP
jgi:hypothetical protein